MAIEKGQFCSATIDKEQFTFAKVYEAFRNPALSGKRLVTLPNKPEAIASTFSAEQHTYIRPTIHGLCFLADGRGTAKDTSPTLTQRTVHYYKIEGNPVFKGALELGIRDIFIDFANQYPFLLPALDALFRDGDAALGLFDAIYTPPELIKQITEGRLRDDNQHTFRRGYKQFISEMTVERPTAENISKVNLTRANAFCPAINLSQTIYRHSKQAALQLHQTGDLRQEGEIFKDTTHIDFPLFVSQLLAMHIS